MITKIIYDDSYNFSLFGLEKLHTFQADKFRQIKNKLIESGCFSDDHFFPPKFDENLIFSYLDDEYRHALYKDKTFIAMALQLWFLRFIPYFILKAKLINPMIMASCGTVETIKLAMKHGLALNLGGGFHHASFYHGRGFCLFPDIPIAIREIRKDYPNLKIAVIDCDAHQGDGTQRALRKEDNTLMVDMFDYRIFPGDEEAKEFINVKVQLGPVRDPEYLDALQKIVLPAVKKFKPGLIIFGAGTDIYEKDPLSYLNVTAKGIIERDKTIVDFAKENNIPLATVLSSGYHPDSVDIIAESILQNYM